MVELTSFWELDIFVETHSRCFGGGVSLTVCLFFLSPCFC